MHDEGHKLLNKPSQVRRRELVQQACDVLSGLQKTSAENEPRRELCLCELSPLSLLLATTNQRGAEGTLSESELPTDLMFHRFLDLCRRARSAASCALFSLTCLVPR